MHILATAITAASIAGVATPSPAAIGSKQFHNDYYYRSYDYAYQPVCSVRTVRSYDAAGNPVVRKVRICR
ncbi:hypothetical protein QO002_002485 [Pararhizobium capsulatum DSM 1112]|uniref:Secreted protein n=1 Tax=Pararhizobium capsulatum DSM 1112 TaxID=1121113 RepID=A0ABU0BU21_9HYPH|nr:hypothetical protein [Pararhizobium capsulatum]MDQ0320347.1 hypothetical protein [Pararhizobium capsulatum DSM 1112]